MRPHLVMILFGLAAIALGVYEYYDLAQMETQGGSRRVHSVIKLVYENLGKNGVLGVFGGAGLVIVGFGLFKMARRRRDELAA
jgi:hypothetical protein